MALAWTQLPSGTGGAGQLAIFPAFEPPVMQALSDRFQAAHPTWEIVANPDMSRAPETLRPQLLDATTRSYGIQLRVTIAEAVRNDPTLFSLDEGELTEGQAPATTEASDDASAPADSTASPAVPKSE